MCRKTPSNIFSAPMKTEDLSTFPQKPPFKPIFSQLKLAYISKPFSFKTNYKKRIFLHISERNLSENMSTTHLAIHIFTAVNVFNVTAYTKKLFF